MGVKGMSRGYVYPNPAHSKHHVELWRIPEPLETGRGYTSTKNCKPTTYKDYCPISLLYHLSEVAEQVIINKLKPSLNDIITSDQYAYQPKIGTVDALLQLVDDIPSTIDGFGVKYVQLASIDFSNAFDRLQPQIVIDKMIKNGFNSNIVVRSSQVRLTNGINSIDS